MTHYTEQYLLNPPHRVTVDLIGAGGTGSQMLQHLGRINAALIGIGHPGLHVRAWDPDIVTESNLGRQLFSPAELNMNKAVALVTKMNRFYGSDWNARAELYGQKLEQRSNITISCVDTAAARIDISEVLKQVRNDRDIAIPYYWLDLGNMTNSGQVVLGTIGQIKQPKKSDAVEVLPDVIAKFPELKKIKEKDQGPSCSLAEALTRQDLMINSAVACFGANLIWKLFRETKIRFHGAFINLESFAVSAMPITKPLQSKPLNKKK